MAAGVHDREPCPWRIVDDAGGAFAFGLVGGGVWNFVGGVRNAPKGLKIKLYQGWTRSRARAPILGGSFAVWGTLFSCCDCSLAHFRRKEDMWNAILGGAITGGLLASRAGFKAAARNFVVGGVILGMIEGLNMAITRVLLPSLEKQQVEAGLPIDLLEPPRDPLRISSTYNPGSISSGIWEKSPTDNSQAHTGFDIDSVSKFDTYQDKWQSEEASRVQPPSSEKSSWKFW